MPTSTGLYDTSTITYDQSSLSYDGYPAPLENLPAVGVYVAFTDGPYVAEPVWSDVSYLTRDVSIRRGRQDDLQQFPSGQCSITFDNRDRYFDPFNTASPAPFNGNLKPRRQVKVVAIWNGVAYPLFRGFVAGWPVEYTEAGLDSTVTVDCFDLLGLIATEKVPNDWVQYYTTSLTPRHYYQLNDGRGATYLRDQNAAIAPNLNIPDPTPIIKWAESETMGRGNLSSSLTFLRGVGKAATSATVTPDLSTSMWYKPIFDNSGTGADIRFQVGQSEIMFTTTTTTSRVTVGNGTNDRVYSFTIVSTDSAYLTFVMTANAGGIPTVVVYVNGQAVATTIVSTTAAGKSPQENSTIYGAQCQERALFDYALTADQVLTLYNFNASAVVESTTARMQRILDTTSVPTALVNLTSTPINNVCDLPPGVNAAQALQEVSTSEDGALFVASDGRLTFYSQQYWSANARSNTSQMTFTDTGLGIEYDAQAVRYRVDADTIRNNINVGFSAGGQVSSSDAASIAANGAASETVNTYLQTPDSALTFAAYLVSIYKNPKLALDPFVAKGQQDPAYNWPLLLNLELLDRVTFKRTPSVGSAVQRDLLVQSVEHRITPGTWETVVNGSTRYTGWFIIGTSLLGSSEDVLL